MPERADGACVLVHAEFGRPEAAAAEAEREFAELASSAGLAPRAALRFRRRAPHRRLYFGPGQAGRLRDCARARGVRLAVLDADPSPGQERNLERELECRVLGRTGLILDIFAQRARSHEGKLQVELAQLSYLATRLVRGWSHLERQKGGIGLRGPGETQLELDRRLLTRRLQNLRRRLEQVARQRRQSRARRRRMRLPQVALVGYTNAGKSTLFNRLTGSDELAADRPFATLDPTCRRLRLPGGPELALSDTVGFIRALPPELVRAFHATLESVRECDLLLHVIDRADEEHAARAACVRAVLGEIGAGRVPVLEVHNKADLPAAAAAPPANGAGVWLSARTGRGVDALLERLRAQLRSAQSRVRLRLPRASFPLRAELYRVGQVEAERYTEGGECELSLWLAPPQLARFARYRVPAAAAPGRLLE